MSQRCSGYDRKENDLYQTPTWVTLALNPHLPGRVHNVWEPAAGGGKMVSALRSLGYNVFDTDATRGHDFLKDEVDAQWWKDGWVMDAIVTNPPYGLAQRFIEHAIEYIEPAGGVVAMLLRTDYDHAKTRQHLFGDCKVFARKVVLTRRIQWFEQKVASPSYNHAWFVWDHQHYGPPVLAYGPQQEKGNARIDVRLSQAD